MSYLFPDNLFDPHCDFDTEFWTCIRSRPRWEKKLAKFLYSRRIAYYLPIMLRSTYSGRKKRVSSIPVFPGYLFVKGNYNKQSFIDSACVCYVLKPKGVLEEKNLDQQLRSVWQALTGTKDIERETRYADGDRIRIMSGPLKGLSGTLVCSDQCNKVTVWVDMLGVGVSVKLSPDTETMKYDSPMKR